MTNRNGMCEGSVTSLTREFYSHKMYATFHYRKSAATSS